MLEDADMDENTLDIILKDLPFAYAYHRMALLSYARPLV